MAGKDANLIIIYPNQERYSCLGYTFLV